MAAFTSPDWWAKGYHSFNWVVLFFCSSLLLGYHALLKALQEKPDGLLARFSATASFSASIALLIMAIDASWISFWMVVLIGIPNESKVVSTAESVKIEVSCIPSVNYCLRFEVSARSRLTCCSSSLSFKTYPPKTSFCLPRSRLRSSSLLMRFFNVTKIAPLQALNAGCFSSVFFLPPCCRSCSIRPLRSGALYKTHTLLASATCATVLKLSLPSKAVGFPVQLSRDNFVDKRK